jgi:hypothetical protein
VQIGIERWASDEEREALYTTLVEAGPNKLLDRIRKMPPAGYIRTPDSVGYDLRYARKTKIGDDEQIVLVTDRPIGFWEAKNQPRVADYPFTVIELRIKPNGEGEGKLSVATKITADPDGRGIVLENYGISPILLNAVKKGRS